MNEEDRQYLLVRLLKIQDGLRSLTEKIEQRKALAKKHVDETPHKTSKKKVDGQKSRGSIKKKR